MKISRYATDKEAEANGVWVKLDDGAEILVARIGNPAYDELLRLKTKPYRRQIQRGTFSVQRQDDILLEVVAETVLLGWKGIEDDAGKAIKYSKERALELMKAYPDFRDDVFDAASMMETFRKDEKDADTKNSSAS